jgi:hypothetical protein
MRQRENVMEVWDWQQLGFSGLKPSLPWDILALWTMTIPAGVIGNPFLAAMITPFDVATEFGGSAT